MIHRVKIFRLNPNLTTEQVIVFRMGGAQTDAKAFGERVRTRWMNANPGQPTTMVLDWPTSEELGGKHVMPDRDELG